MEKKNYCEMRGDHFHCVSTRGMDHNCKHFVKNIDRRRRCLCLPDWVECTSKPANKEAAETAVRLGQEYLAKTEKGE